MRWSSGCGRAGIKTRLEDERAPAELEGRLPAVDRLVAAGPDLSEAVGVAASTSTSRTVLSITRSGILHSTLHPIPSPVSRSRNPTTFSNGSEARWVVRSIFRSYIKAAAKPSFL